MIKSNYSYPVILRPVPQRVLDRRIQNALRALARKARLDLPSWAQAGFRRNDGRVVTIKRLIQGFLLLLICVQSQAASPAPVVAKQAMVVSAQHLATQVGINILRRGGNAVDAAVAMGYTLAVVHPCCGNIGGGGFMVIHLAKPRPYQLQNAFINFREKAPYAIKPSLFLHQKDSKVGVKFSKSHLRGLLTQGYLAAGVPGTVMGMNTALERFGTMSLKQVITPAIRFARDGFILTQGDVKILDTGTKSFKQQKNVAKIFLNDGKPYQVGQRLVQKNLARTLERIERYGTKAFYAGDIARDVVEASKEHGGIFTLRDFADYTVSVSKSLHCRYRGYQIYTAALPSGGGVTLCEMLNITEGYPLDKLGFHTAKSVHYQVEAMRYAYADRNSRLGDPDFVHNPVKLLISKDHANAIRKRIQPNKATPSKILGFIAHNNEGHDTTSYSVVDRWGNAVAVTYTINNYFGAKVIPGKLGFFLNDEMADFTIKPGIANVFGLVQGKANIMAPAKRPLSAMTPTIIMKHGRLFMVLGAPGGPTIPTQLFQVIQNVIDFHMNIAQAVSAGRFHMQWLPDKVYLEPYTLSQDTLKILEGMGYTFQLGAPYGSRYWGKVMAILKNPKTGRLEGAADVRAQAGLAMGIN